MQKCNVTSMMSIVMHFSLDGMLLKVDMQSEASKVVFRMSRGNPCILQNIRIQERCYQFFLKAGFLKERCCGCSSSKRILQRCRIGTSNCGTCLNGLICSFGSESFIYGLTVISFFMFGCYFLFLYIAPI